MPSVGLVTSTGLAVSFLVNGTAGDDDYSGLTGGNNLNSVIFAAGQSQKTVVVTPVARS